MRVSVIISNYNYGRFLPLAINSLLSQTESVDEIIVVDDGSTDDSRAVLNSYGNAIITIHQDNAGQAAAISKGFAKATGDIVCILDADDVFFPDKTNLLKKIYQNHPDAGWVFHSLKHIAPNEASRSASFPRYENVSVRSVDQQAAIRKGRPSYEAPATSGLSFRREFIFPMFPLPHADSIYISDHYIKFYALAAGPGVHVAESMGGQIIHGDNLYTRTKFAANRGRLLTTTAFHLKQMVPELRKFCTKLMVEGAVSARLAGVYDEVSSVVNEYINTLPAREAFVARLRYWIKVCTQR
jgi:glycosyltransferase involved in cell wall biosynthesis